MKVGSDVVTLQATISLFSRLLVIVRSSCKNVDLPEVIDKHEFAYVHRMLMQTDGALHPTNDKSKVIHPLSDLVNDDNDENDST